MTGAFQRSAFQISGFQVEGAAEEDDRARRALEHYRLGWARYLLRQQQDEDEAWLVLTGRV